MTDTRKVNKVFHSKPTLEGAGVSLHRAFGFGDTKLFDPFLLLDDFRGDSPEEYIKGFPWHPHRGIETITYVLAGQVAHADSLGNRGVISAGDVQWMTAGSGIIHQEMPKGDPDGRMYGFQLWANLPKGMKMMDPRYRDVKNASIPELELENGIRVRLIAGELNGVCGPVQDIVIDPAYLDVSIPPDTVFTHPTPQGHTVFTYIFEGQGIFCDPLDPYSTDAEGSSDFDLRRDAWLGNRTLAVFGDGDRIQATTGAEGVRFLFISGWPIREPVAWYGPIVMNTAAELQTAFDEYQKGTFIKVEAPRR